MLIKFKCGCIGLGNLDKAGRSCILVSCEARDEEDQIMVGWRNMKGKYRVPLDDVEASVRLMDSIGSLISDGYRLRRIQGIQKFSNQE